MAPSQTLPDIDTLKFSRSVSRLDEEDEDEWNRTIRPAGMEPPLPRSVAHSRESSLEKVQVGVKGAASSQSPPAVISPRTHGTSARQGMAAVLERTVDPKAATYGHHRQTSIVHGIQHSRNGSLVSPSSSPLSPQILAAAGAGFTPDRSDMPSFAMRAEGDSLAGPRPLTNMSGSTMGSAGPFVPERTSSVTDLTVHTHNQRKLERMHSGRVRRDHSHHHSHSSRHHKDEQKTVGEYALHVLFTSFIAQAEEKLNDCVTVPFDPEPHIEHICGPGVDASFDQLIVALGHIAKQRPKPLIDSMMLWRKSKSDAANEARNQLQQSKAHLTSPGPLQRRNTEPVHMLAGNSAADNGPAGPGTLAAKQEFVAQAERRSTVSIYILCRVLLEVITQSNLASITPEMEDKLEGIIFGQLKIADAEQLFLSPLKLANWNLFAQLLGVMSDINFTSVADRFLGDLERSLLDHAAKSPTVADIEGKMELVLGGMKHLRIKTTPPEAWEQTCDFMISLGKLFNKSHGQRVKSAFCQVIELLLMPVAANASSTDLSNPKWGDVLSNVSPRLGQMFVKPRHWSSAFPLTATMLCVSPPDSFANQWLQLVYSVQTKLKDRATKPLSLQVVSRLVWTYLYRTNDSTTGVIRKLDEVMKNVLPTAKRTITAADTAVTEPLIQIIRCIGFKHPEYCFRTIIFPLINAELFTSGRELKVENLEPDKIVIGIRAFLAIIGDLEKGEQGRPPFPQSYFPGSPTERMPGSPTISSPRATPFLRGKDQVGDSPSTPVVLSALSDTVREYYTRFCAILGKITLICDNTFGGQAVLDEKFNSPGPKTPIAETFNFSRREDHLGTSDHKQAFYELLHVAVQALPRCLSSDIPFHSLINLLCTGTAHVQYNIAESSIQSLKSIARQSHAQQVTMGFSRFIFNFDDRYSTMSDGGMLGPGHIENTLKLYVELLQIWIEEIKRKNRDAAADTSDSTALDKRAATLDRSTIWAEVDQAEAHGLFFLCSQSRRVRYFAITTLRLIKDFAKAVGDPKMEKSSDPRLIDILENDSMQLMNFRDESLSVAERSRLERGMANNNNQGALIELCTSDVSYDTTLWFKIFPNLIRTAYEKCPFTVTLCRDLICNRILQMYKAIVLLSEPSRGLYYGSDPGSARYTGRTPTTQPELLIEQWKLYLVFACTTLADPGGGSPPSGQGSAQHGRKSSKNSSSTDKIVTARTLFKYLNPLLSVSSASIRDAVVVAMGSINIHIYRTLLEELQGHVSRCNDEARARIHQRTGSSPRRNTRLDLLRTEITHVYKLTAHFLKLPEVYQDDWVMTNLVTYAKDIKLFLMDGEVQMDWEFQKLRRHYCGLVEELFQGINRTKDPTGWMTFEARKSSFTLMEDWCGFSPNQSQIRHREDSMRQSIIDSQGIGERGTLTAAMEIEKRNLRTAALSAMASLCGGPIGVTTESGVSLQFDIRRMLAWIESIFNSGNDRMKVIGKRALKNLIIHNQDYPYLLEHCIGRCYKADVPKVLESYFEVVTEVLREFPDYPLPFWRLLGLCLFTLGNDQSEIRSKSAQVLRALEERQQGRSSKIQDFDISISDKTKAVYKLAQFKISERLSKQHTGLAFHIFSEFTFYFKDLHPVAQRNVIAVTLPWIQSIELKLDPNGGPTAQSYVLLANLLEITIKSSGALHNEVQALWQALATGPHPGNVRLILDFIMDLCLERREQNFVEYAKQIVVFLASTQSTPGHKVVEFLLMQITPKAMVPFEKRETPPLPPDINLFPYCADLSEALPMGTKQAGFSLGQLSLILLVDLMVSPVNLSTEHLPVLLQVVTVLWDHYTPLVQEQAREMLVHLIHELVISKLDEKTSAAIKPIEDLIDSIRRHDKTVVWSYEDHNGKVDNRDNNVPPAMDYLTSEVVKTFEITFPGIKEQWGRLSLTWATSCPVRHLACRSFQIFRCILTSLDHIMLADMLARLSNTIADEDPEIQTFSMEILTTLKTLISKLDPEKLVTFPQLFWTTCACLESINECEFLEAVEMLDDFLERLDFHDPGIRRLIMEGQPANWDGPFEGLQPLLYKGLRSSLCLSATLKAIDKLVRFPSDPLIGDDSRFFFTVLANSPRLLQEMEADQISPEVTQTVQNLGNLAIAQGLHHIARALDEYLSRTYSTGNDFIVQLFSALREYFSPRLDFPMITALIGLLTNSTSWVKVQTMRILCVLIPEVDMRNPEIAGHGSDLISPLLRLLQTEFCMDALKVLDNIMTMSGSAMDKHHLRMSMTRYTSKTIRKEYERTQSLFGIPEDSGWAIPVPAKKTESTRANIHAAFYTCQSTEGMFADATPTPEVEFHEDEFPYGYFSPSDRTDTMMSDEGRGDSNVGDLVTVLDSLDDFFDDIGTSPPSDGRSSMATITESFAEGFTSDAQLYDEHILPILHQASNTTAFQNGFVDKPTIPRDGSANTMNPGAFNFDQNANAGRPALHFRSVTSPSAPASYHPNIMGLGDLTSDDEHEDVFSDGDDERMSTGGPEGSFFLENMIKPLAQGTRSRMRRLTGGRSRDERAEGRLPISPQVPKLPNAYQSMGP